MAKFLSKIVWFLCIFKKFENFSGPVAPPEPPRSDLLRSPPLVDRASRPKSFPRALMTFTQNYWKIS